MHEIRLFHYRYRSPTPHSFPGDGDPVRDPFTAGPRTAREALCVLSPSPPPPIATWKNPAEKCIICDHVLCVLDMLMHLTECQKYQLANCKMDWLVAIVISVYSCLLSTNPSNTAQDAWPYSKFKKENLCPQHNTVNGRAAAQYLILLQCPGRQRCARPLSNARS